jgi:type IV secretory pathway VirB2 component (pilin)
MKLWYNVALLLVVGAINMFGAGAGVLPWEVPLDRIGDSVTGPVAFILGIAGIAVSGGMLLFHGDLTEFGRKASLAGLAGGTLTLAPTFVTNVFGVTGALI